MVQKPCYACKGRRLKPEVLAITVSGQSIMDICELSIDDAIDLVGPENWRREGRWLS